MFAIVNLGMPCLYYENVHSCSWDGFYHLIGGFTDDSWSKASFENLSICFLLCSVFMHFSLLRPPLFLDLVRYTDCERGSCSLAWGGRETEERRNSEAFLFISARGELSQIIRRANELGENCGFLVWKRHDWRLQGQSPMHRSTSIMLFWLAGCILGWKSIQKTHLWSKPHEPVTTFSLSLTTTSISYFHAWSPMHKATSTQLHFQPPYPSYPLSCPRYPLLAAHSTHHARFLQWSYPLQHLHLTTFPNCTTNSLSLSKSSSPNSFSYW